MSVQSYIDKLKIVEERLLKFLDYECNEEENYENLIAILIDQNFRTDPYQLKMFLYLLSNLSNYHHRCKNFFDKIQKLIKSFEKEMKQFFSNWTIFKIFSKNKRLLLILFEETIITIDIDIYKTMFEEKYKRFHYLEYFSPEIETFINKEFDEKQKKKEKKKISNSFRLINDFYEKRKKADFLYDVIQQDLIEDFIIYVNKNDYQLNNFIEISIFETNPFLLKHNAVSLIELAVFFGSDQIFKYLYKNDVELKQSLWEFAIHGENPEIIQILEEKIGKLNNNIEKCYTESIKCHHNDMANYIQNNYLVLPSDKIQNAIFNSIILAKSIRYCNFLYIQDVQDILNLILLACRYDYFTLVKLLLSTYHFDIYQIKILNLFNYLIQFASNI